MKFALEVVVCVAGFVFCFLFCVLFFTFSLQKKLERATTNQIVKKWRCNRSTTKVLFSRASEMHPMVKQKTGQTQNTISYYRITKYKYSNKQTNNKKKMSGRLLLNVAYVGSVALNFEPQDQLGRFEMGKFSKRQTAQQHNAGCSGDISKRTLNSTMAENLYPKHSNSSGRLFLFVLCLSQKSRLSGTFFPQVSPPVC